MSLRTDSDCSSLPVLLVTTNTCCEYSDSLSWLLVMKAKGMEYSRLQPPRHCGNSHRMTQCYLPPGRGDIPALTPAEAGAQETVFVNTGTLCHACYTHTHTHPFNGPLSGNTQVSRYQKGKKPIWILLKQETVSGSGISWAIMQVCISLQTDNHASTPSLSFFAGRMPFLPPNLCIY